MDWQQLVSLTIVSAAAVLLLRDHFRPRKFSFQRATHCGGCAHANAVPQHTIIFPARIGCRTRMCMRPITVWSLKLNWPECAATTSKLPSKAIACVSVETDRTG